MVAFVVWIVCCCSHLSHTPTRPVHNASLIVLHCIHHFETRVEQRLARLHRVDHVSPVHRNASSPHPQPQLHICCSSLSEHSANRAYLPPRPPRRGESIERTDEHEGFIQKLQQYHERRGTPLDTQPKVGIRHIDLHKLYQRVVEEGGYDLCSDTKAKPLMWRRLAEEFVGKNQYTAAQAFQVKNVYYKNLCAYEISNHWGKEPPPKEILEEMTAKGGNVMTRTLENYQRAPTKEERDLVGEDSEPSPEQQKTTPKPEAAGGADATAGEDPGSAAGSRTRGLRQAPPQRVLFQPDLTSGRQTRGVAQATSSPTPGQSNNILSGLNLSAASATLANYEPPQSYPLTLKPVTTPANNPDHYRNVLKRKTESQLGPLARKYRNIMLPGTGFIGPNIYVRAQMALQSGIQSEEEYALHHLVKISHERGDKYRFDQFPGLAEALVKKALQVSSLFYDVDWDVCYDEEAMYYDEETLNGLSGTSDAIQKLQSRTPLVTGDGVQDARWREHMDRVLEAALVVRNMCLQGENAQYLARQPMVRDYLAIVLNLPLHSGVAELQSYAVDTAEQLLVWCDLEPGDAVYSALLGSLEKSQDRGTIIGCLRTVARVGMHLPGPKRLDDVTPALLGRVQSWLMVDDEELRSACLDFLFQYTSFADNVDFLISNLDGEALARQLSRLLLFAAREEKPTRPPTRQTPSDDDNKTPTLIPRLSRSVVESLLKIDEPERSSEWLRMCFLSDKESEMTQISLWQAYQQTFAPHQAVSPHLVAGEFIKNVSATFVGATAQVAGQNKYVIRGIRARKAPVDTGMLPGSSAGDKGKTLSKCAWRVVVPAEIQHHHMTGVPSAPTATREVPCSEYFKSSEKMLQHILRDHLQLPRKPPVLDGNPNPSDRMDLDARSSRPGSAMAGVANGARTPSARGTPVPPSSTARVDPKLTDLFDFVLADKALHRCRWASGCTRTSADFEFPSSDHSSPATAASISRTALFARHVQTHLPDPTKTSMSQADSQQPSSTSRTSNTAADGGAGGAGPAGATLFKTLEDEKGDAAGVPLGAARVLRNLAKFMPVGSDAEELGMGMGGEKAVTNKALGMSEREVDGMEGGEGKGRPVTAMERVFGEEVLARLVFALTHARPIHGYVGSVLRAVGRG